MDNSIEARIQRAQSVYEDANLEEVFDAAGIVKGCKTNSGESIFDSYRRSSEFSALVGIAYMMGVEEGMARADQAAREGL